MGEKRISKRTLDSGEQVIHHPPDDQHPEGKMVLVRTGSPLRERLDAALEDNQTRHAEIHQAHADRIEAKKVAQFDRGLPSEKSPI